MLKNTYFDIGGKGTIFLEEYKKKNTKKTPSVDCCKSSKRKESFQINVR